MLGKPIPPVPFPYLNKGASGGGAWAAALALHPIQKRMINEAQATVGAAGIMAGVSLYLTYHFLTTPSSDSYICRYWLAGADAVLNMFGYFRK